MAILSLATLSCKKDPAVNIESFEITRENLNVGASVATITGTYSYAGVIDGMEACVSEVETGLNVGAFPAISTTGMVPGVYVLRLIEGEKERTQKIVIQ